MFRPVIESQERQREEAKRMNRGRVPRALKGQLHVKIGHGGTLDPGASGVVSFGLGSGTKALTILQSGVEKGYETVVLFGQATDTFDREGKVVGRKSFEGVTREKVEDALKQFRGKITQRPSVYSALSRGGVRMYEYARQGKDIPELEKREMNVTEMEIVEWMDGGTHDYHWITDEVQNDRKEAFVKALRFDEIGGVEVVKGVDADSEELKESGKRKRKDADEAQAAEEPASKQTKTTEDGEAAAIQDTTQNNDSKDSKEDSNGDAPSSSASISPCPAPAVRLRLTVSSGFYVRSLCHDLGVAVGSLAYMASLVRNKQACFELGKNVIDLADFDKDEEIWAPQLREQLDAWPQRYDEIKKKAEAKADA